MRSWVHCSDLLVAEALVGSARRLMKAGITSSNSVMHSYSINTRPGISHVEHVCGQWCLLKWLNNIFPGKANNDSCIVL